MGNDRQPQVEPSSPADSAHILAAPTWQPYQAEVISPAPSPDATLSVSSSSGSDQRQVRLKLVSSELETNCHFWIGLACQGPLNPAELIREPSLAAVFSKAATTGISDGGPVMLSDSETTPARFIYLLPPPASDEGAESRWLQQLHATVQAWSPEALGIYLAPELLASERALGLLRAMLARMVRSTKSEQFYLLLGAHGLSRLLNATLELKADLGSSGVELLVFH